MSQENVEPTLAKPSYYVAPSISDKKKFITQDFEFNDKSIADLAIEYKVKPTTILKYILDCFQNDMDVDFDRVYTQFDYMTADRINIAKDIICKLEQSKGVYCHCDDFRLKEVFNLLSEGDSDFNEIATSDIYNIIHVAQAQLYYDRWSYLPRKSSRTLIKNGSYITSNEGGGKKESNTDPEDSIFGEEVAEVSSDILENMTPYEKEIYLKEKKLADQSSNQGKKRVIKRKRKGTDKTKPDTEDEKLAKLYDLSGQVLEEVKAEGVVKEEENETDKGDETEGIGEEGKGETDDAEGNGEGEEDGTGDESEDPEQALALEAMRDGHNIFLTGPAGTGKSHVLKRYIDWASNHFDHFDREVAITSTTGASAVLIGGITLHSFSGIGFGDDSVDSYVQKFRGIPKYRNRWRGVRVWIIDEISMLSPILWDKLDEIGRRMRGRLQVPFGGIQMIVSGDFCQLPTVSDKDFCFQSNQWKKTIGQVHYLHRVFRQRDPVFQRVLEKVRIGIVDSEVESVLTSRQQPLEKKHGIQPTVLFSVRAHASEYNQKKIDNLIKKKKKFESYPAKYQFSAKAKSKRDRNMLQEFIDRLFHVDDPLELTIDSQVMVTVNLPDLGLCNGSRGIVEKFNSDRAPVVRFLDGRLIVMPVHCWKFIYDKKTVTKIQYPLRLAWAMTIHKSQGMSLDYVHADLGSIFEYGQAYVVLSRVRSLEGLYLSSLNVTKIKAHPDVLRYEKEISGV